MAESLLLPLVCSVACKASDGLIRSVTRGMWGVDDDRDRLERQLLAVQSIMADAESKSASNPAINRWMKDLRAAAYDADDVLDNFRYEALRREAQRAPGFMPPKVPSYFTVHNPFLLRSR